MCAQVWYDSQSLPLSKTLNTAKSTRWEVIVGFDIFTELSLFCLSIYLVATLQMAVKYKLITVVVFGLRLP